MYHICAFTKSIAQNADTQVDGLTDTIFNLNGGLFTIPSEMMLLAAAAMSANIVRAKLVSPKISQFNPLFIRPVEKSVTPTDVPRYRLFSPGYPTLRMNEGLQCVANHGGAGAEQVTVFAWVSPSLEQIPAGEIYTVRATSTGVATANAWTVIAYTLDTVLPVGTYALIGSDVISTNAQAHRWILDNQYLRPGLLSATDETFNEANMNTGRELGVMGRFASYNLPRLEVLANGADNSHTIYQHLVKVS